MVTNHLTHSLSLLLVTITIRKTSGYRWLYFTSPKEGLIIRYRSPTHGQNQDQCLVSIELSCSRKGTRKWYPTLHIISEQNSIVQLWMRYFGKSLRGWIIRAPICFVSYSGSSLFRVKWKAKLEFKAKCLRYLRPGLGSWTLIKNLRLNSL